jgi:hypothetical protein
MSDVTTSPAEILTRIKLGTVIWMGNQVSLRIFSNSSANLVINCNFLKKKNPNISIKVSKEKKLISFKTTTTNLQLFPEVQSSNLFLHTLSLFLAPHPK